MNKPQFDVSDSRRRPADRGQGLVEYAILIAIIGVVSIFGLILLGGSVQGGFIKVCAALGNEGCQVVERESVVVGTATPTLQVTPTPSAIPTATLAYLEPDPTRAPVLTVLAPPAPAPVSQLITMRIKVVLSDKGGGKKSPAGIRVVIYDASGKYVTDGVTDDKGNVSLSVVSGNYFVSTFYNNVWQKDGPITVTNSKENVIHR